MAGLSAKLTSLVEAAEDPFTFYYAYTHLGNGVPDDAHSRGFHSRVIAIRKQLLTLLFKVKSPLERISQEQKDLQREEVELNRKERALALTLFQKSTLNIVNRHISTAKPQELRKHLLHQDPIVRFLAIQTVGSRHLHLEADLIERLTDPDPVVCVAARTALVRVARGTDFGPIPGSSRRSLDRSIEKWKQWLALQQSESPGMLAKAAKEKRAKPTALDVVPLVLAHEDRSALPSAVAKVCEELVNAKGDEQRSVLARLRDGKDNDSIEALALAIPKLTGDIQQEARNALTERLTRLTETALRDKLQDDNPEVRCAAALACGRKIAKEHLADLLQLLDDPEKDVVQSARAALTELTGEDFGPLRGADSRGHAEAVAAWRQWWKEYQNNHK